MSTRRNNHLRWHKTHICFIFQCKLQTLFLATHAVVVKITCFFGDELTLNCILIRRITLMISVIKCNQKTLTK